MSHTDYVETVPEGFKNIASTPSCPNAAMENPDKKLYGIKKLDFIQTCKRIRYSLYIAAQHV